MISSQRQALKSVIIYGLLALSAAWLIWTAVEIRYYQGWYEAQGVNDFYYPYREIAAGALALVAGSILVRTKWWPAAVVLAVFVLATTEIFWIGSTR